MSLHIIILTYNYTITKYLEDYSNMRCLSFTNTNILLSTGSNIFYCYWPRTRLRIYKTLFMGSGCEASRLFGCIVRQLYWRLCVRFSDYSAINVCMFEFSKTCRREGSDGSSFDKPIPRLNGSITSILGSDGRHYIDSVGYRNEYLKYFASYHLDRNESTSWIGGIVNSWISNLPSQKKPNRCLTLCVDIPDCWYT